MKEGFLSGLVFGISAQHLNCNGKEQCAKGRIDQWSATPFFDIRATPKLQVRFSVPLVHYKAVGQDGNDLVPTLTLAGQVSGV